MFSIKKILFCLTSLGTLVCADDLSQPFQEPLGPVLPGTPTFVINNRPLVRINGTVISLMDVVKKMDMVIHQHFPDTRKSPVSLFQFYSSQWQRFLEEMVFNELMLADAEVKEIKVSDGDVREEMQQRFGPNIIATLSSLNLQYEEVRKMVHSELVVRQIQGMKIYSKAYQNITPERIKKEYFVYCEANPPSDEWEYQVVTFRGKEEEACKQIAKRFSEDLKLDNTKLGTLALEDSYTKNTNVVINVSKDYKVSNKNLSQHHRNVLANLQENTFSEPVCQTSKNDPNAVYRIFYLKSHHIDPQPTFDQLNNEIKSALIEKAVEEAKKSYEDKLAQKFGFGSSILKDIVPEDYQPFSLR